MKKIDLNLNRRKYIPVDVYGKCGEFSCPAASPSGAEEEEGEEDGGGGGGGNGGGGGGGGGDGGWDCYGMAQRKYKFLVSVAFLIFFSDTHT